MRIRKIVKVQNDRGYDIVEDKVIIGKDEVSIGIDSVIMPLAQILTRLPVGDKISYQTGDSNKRNWKEISFRKLPNKKSE